MLVTEFPLDLVQSSASVPNSEAISQKSLNIHNVLSSKDMPNLLYFLEKRDEYIVAYFYEKNSCGDHY